MERVDAIMERLGFNKESDDGTKAAFIKNLIKQAYGVEVNVPPQYEMLAKEKAPHTMEDLGREALEGKPLPQKSSRGVALSRVNPFRSAAKEQSQLSFQLDYVEAEKVTQTAPATEGSAHEATGANEDSSPKAG